MLKRIAKVIGTTKRGGKHVCPCDGGKRIPHWELTA